jgi:RNA polymerase sigma-70 factor (ECF subfamily)
MVRVAAARPPIGDGFDSSEHWSTATIEDAELLRAARAGDGACFEAVYRRHNRVVLAFLARRVAEPELAADLLAETFAALLVLVRDQRRELPETPVAWLLGTARHLLIDAYRRGRVEAAARRQLAMQPLALDDGDLRRIEEISAETDILAELSAILPAAQLEALRARVIDEREYPAIARELRCSEAVVRKRVSRALRTLRRSALGAEGHA